jgi:serine/threonine protein kinase
MELVEGGELFNYLVKKKHLDENDALVFFQQLIHGLDYCHKHFIWCANREGGFCSALVLT